MSSVSEGTGGRRRLWAAQRDGAHSRRRRYRGRGGMQRRLVPVTGTESFGTVRVRATAAASRVLRTATAGINKNRPPKTSVAWSLHRAELVTDRGRDDGADDQVDRGRPARDLAGAPAAIGADPDGVAALAGAAGDDRRNPGGHGPRRQRSGGELCRACLSRRDRGRHRRIGVVDRTARRVCPDHRPRTVADAADRAPRTRPRNSHDASAHRLGSHPPRPRRDERASSLSAGMTARGPRPVAGR